MNTKKPPINFKEFEGFSNEVVKCFQNGGKNIATVLSKFPMLLAEALNLQNAILIIDHYDELDPEFCSEFSKAFSKTSFILSARDDKKFFSVFQKTNAVFLYTENLIKPRDERVLSVPELKLQLTANDCFGSPGYLVSFTEICDLIENYNQHVQTDQSARGKFHNIRAKTELSRKFFIRQKLFNLCVALYSAHSKIIKSLTLNGLGDISDSNFTFQLTGDVNRDLLYQANSESEEEDEDSFHHNEDRNASPNSHNNSRISSKNNSPENYSNGRRGSLNNNPNNYNDSKKGSRNNSPDNLNDNRLGRSSGNKKVGSPTSFSNSRDRFNSKNDFKSSDSYGDNNRFEYDDDDDDYEYDNYGNSPRNRQSSQMLVVEKNDVRGRGGVRNSINSTVSGPQKQRIQRTSNLRSSLDNQQSQKINPNANVSFAPNLKQGQQSQRLSGSNSLRSSNNGSGSQKKGQSAKDSIQRRKSDFDSTSSDD